MGFMGLNHWSESDMAADFHAKLRLSVRSMFRQELKNRANEYNTPGWLNALLIFKEYPSIASMLDKATLNKIDAEIEKDLGYLNDGAGFDLIRNFRSIRLSRSFFDKD